MDYRLAREAGFPGMLLDVKAAVRWLRGRAPEFDIDPDALFFWGGSADAHLAQMAAMYSQPHPTGPGGNQKTGTRRRAHHMEPNDPRPLPPWATHEDRPERHGNAGALLFLRRALMDLRGCWICRGRV